MKTRASFVVSLSALVLTLSLPLAVGAGDYVIGGRDVAETDLIKKHVVKLMDPGGTCTGVIYSKRLILTASHCVFGFDPKTFVAHFGDEAGHPEIKIVDAKTHPAFTWKTLEEGLQDVDWGDIALMKLEKDIPQGFSPARMVKDITALNRYKKVGVAGYGQTVFDDAVPMPTILQVGRIPIQDLNYDAFKFLVNGDKKHNICFGDSGGPSFVEIKGHVYIAGVLSQFIPRSYNPREKSDCSQPATYSSVPHYLKWLRETAKILEN